MNRSEAFVLLTLIGLLALVLALAFCVPSTGAQDGTPTPFCVQLNGDHTWLEIGCPTDEPTATPTHTPTPTNTPTPSPTHTPTATDKPPVTVEPSPTPEIGCYGWVNTGGGYLNVRDAPSTATGTILGQLPDNYRAQLHARVVGDVGVIWYRITPDWGGVGFVYGGYIVTENCTPPMEALTREPALMWHSVPGANRWRMLETYAILADKGVNFGVKPYGDIEACIQAIEAGGECIYRAGLPGVPDCPESIGYANPVTSAQEFADMWQWSADALRQYGDAAWLEITNECFYGDENHPEVLVWWAEWASVFLDEAEARDFPRLVMFTFGPGHGDELTYTAWRQVLLRLADMGGMMGEHAYTPYHDNGLCACDEWLACRHRTNEATRQALGIDIDISISEAARGWGNDPVSVSDFVCWYEQVRGDEWVHNVALWTAGYTPYWHNAALDDYMLPIVNGVRAK